jgi:Co/Zn/Cd efflux system component
MVCGLRVQVWKVDAISSTLSLASLLATIVFVTIKAQHLLNSSEQDIVETKEQYQLRGSVLFYFAAASTLGNVAVLVMYQRWHPQHGSLAKKARELQNMEQSNAEGKSPFTSSTSEGTGKGLRTAGASLKAKMGYCRDVDCDSANCPNAQANGPAPDQGDRPMCGACDSDDCDPGNPNHDFKANGKLLGRGRFAFTAKMSRCRDVNCDPASCPDAQPNVQDPDQGDIPMAGFCDDDDSDQGETSMCGVCDDDDCDEPTHHDYNDETNHKVQSGSNSMSLLHTLIHPGCQSCDACSQADSGVKSQHSVESRTAANNLNVASAMLHLMSDIFRGITIFVVAILIKLGVVRNSIRADGVCALMVAGFIFLGAFALFHKVFSVCIADKSDRD